MRSLVYGMLLVSGVAWGAPGELELGSADPTETLAIIEPQAGRACTARGGACVYAGARSTIAAESSAVASTKTSAAVPRFARASTNGKGPWVVELQARLVRPALPGNAVFLIFDADDKEALANHEYTAMYQTSVKAGRALAARLAFHPDEGFRAGHSYRIRVVQLVGGKELALAEVDLTLL